MCYSFKPNRGVLLENYNGEIQDLRDERARLLHEGRTTMEIIKQYKRSGEPVPRELELAIDECAKQIRENTLLLKQVQTAQLASPPLIVGHIEPNILLQKAKDRVQYARKAVRYDKK